MSPGSNGPASNGKIQDEDQIKNLLYDYARIVDQQRFYEWLDLFTDDGTYSAITYENFQEQGLYLFKDDGKEAMKERVTFLMGFWQVGRGKTLHAVSNIQASIHDDEATANSYFVIYRTGDDGVTQFHACGEYEDQLVRRDERWLFQQRKVIVDNGVLPSHFTDLL